MAEEKAEKKKPVTISRIFNWIAAGLLSLLLVAGLIFQPPRKVIALLLVFLCACTVLPKPARKWFWLSVAVIVLALIVWVFLPDETEGWRPYTFDDELAALKAKYAIPDSENAATMYSRLLENHDANDWGPNLPDPNVYHLAQSKPWLSKDYPELAQWLHQENSTIIRLLEASRIRKCRFPIPPDIMSVGPVMKRSPIMRQWAFLLLTASNNDIAEKRPDQALEKCVALLRMAKHVCQQPTTADILVGNALEALAIRQFKVIVVCENPTEEQLIVVESALREIEHNWCSDLYRILEHEKLMMKNLLAPLWETSTKGKIRLARDPSAAIRAQLAEDIPPLAYWQRKLAKARTILAWFFLPSTPQKAAKIIDASYNSFYAMAEPDFDWEKEPVQASRCPKLNYAFMIELLTDILEPPYRRIHEIYLRTVADHRGCQIIIGLRRYKNKTGQWPKSLDDIKSSAPPEIFVDPINAGSFVYKPADDSFTLYSKGQNNIDDDGEGEDYGDGTGTDDWPIWPPRNRDTKEQAADNQAGQSNG